MKEIHLIDLKKQRSEEKYKNLGFFKNVDVKAEAGSKPNLANLNIDVEEQATGDVSLGIAYSTFDEFSTSFGISEKKNFWVEGKELNLACLYLIKGKNFSAGLTQPYLLSRNLTGSFDVFNNTYTDSSR